MKNKKEFFGVLFSVLISVFLVFLGVYATTTIGNDVTVGDDLIVTEDVSLTGNEIGFANSASISNSADAENLVLTETLIILSGKASVSSSFYVGTYASVTTDLSVDGDLLVDYDGAFANALQVGSNATVAYSRFGTGTTGHSLADNDDLLITGLLEVDDVAYLDSSASFAGDIRLSGSATTNYIAWDSSANILEGIGTATLQIGETGGIDNASAATMIYGYYKGITTAITGTGIGVEGQARQSSIDSAAGILQGGFFKAGNGPMSTSGGGNLGTMTGVYAEVVGSHTTGDAAKTVTNARGVEINLDLNQVDTTTTNAYGIYMKWNTDGSAVTNGYGLWIDNEGVGGEGGGGTGQVLDAAIYISDTSLSPGWEYGIDMSNAGMSKADIRLSSSITFSTGTASPSADCTVGSWYFRAGQVVSTSFYFCETANEWDQVIGLDLGDI